MDKEILGKITFQRSDTCPAELYKIHPIHTWKSAQVEGRFDLINKVFTSDDNSVTLHAVEHQPNCHLIYFLDGYDTQIVQQRNEKPSVTQPYKGLYTPVRTFVQCRIDKGTNHRDGYVYSSLVLVDMSRRPDVDETDKTLRKNKICEPAKNETCDFLLEMGFNLCKTQTEADSGANVLYHVMPFELLDAKLTGAVVYEDVHSN